jgi:hypothetical protein
MKSETLEITHKISDRDVMIDELRFSPDSKLLAVGNHLNFIDVYKIEKKAERMGICKVRTFRDMIVGCYKSAIESPDISII